MLHTCVAFYVLSVLYMFVCSGGALLISYHSYLDHPYASVVELKEKQS